MSTKKPNKLMEIIHFNLHASQKHPLEICHEKYDKNHLKIKMEHSTESINLKVISDSSYSIGQQEKLGFFFDETKHYTFEMINIVPNLVVKLFIGDKCIGQSLITEQLLPDDYGTIRICCVLPEDNLCIIGYVTFDYLMIVQCQNMCKLTPDANFAYMGHRGCGKTFDRTAKVLENTIPSFKEAKKRGASFVELDIQLTKDLVPIIFHDDFTAVGMVKNDGKEIFTPVPVKDLTLEQVKTLKMDFARAGAGSCYDNRFTHLFPTLEEVLTEMRGEIGLFLEVKYTEPDQGIVGLMNKKVMVDQIMEVISQNEDNINIMFCSFDPEICLMLRNTQYPVFFITCGENAFTTSNPWQPYDMRTRTRMIAANFAIVHDLDGISINSDPLMNCKDEYSTLTKYLRDNGGKLLYSWGSSNCSNEYVELQKTIGMAGIISDKLENLKINNM